MNRHGLLALALLAALSGCKRRTPREEAPRTADAGAQTVVIEPEGGLDGTQVSRDGRGVWPPVGPGCERYVACCGQASAGSMDVSLFCQMSVATPPVSCERALGALRNYLSERSLAVPAGCGGEVARPPSPPPQVPQYQPPTDPRFQTPITCTQDGDCPRLACGPCVTGQPVTVFYRMVNCARNPCPGTFSVCRQGVCVVR